MSTAVTRAKTSSRGYGTAHQRIRAAWAPRVATGRIICWRCLWPIKADEPWHLGHDDHDRRVYRGPEHEACNIAASNKPRGDPKPKPRTRW